MAIVLPHHNLVASTRQNFLKIIAQKRPITRQIILVAPDHFSTYQNQINIATNDWHLSTGKMEFQNLPFNLSIDNRRLQNDHSIYNPLADLKTYFPQAKIYPILIGQKVTQIELDKLITKITKHCSYDCLFVASVDFSHYLPATLAEVHDAFTIRSLNNFEFDNIIKAEVDSPQSLYLLTKFAASKKSSSFTLFDHTNSGFISRNPDAETTTHVFASFSSGKLRTIDLKTTVTVPTQLIRKNNQDTLGDRFFYGVDEFKVDSSSNFVTATIEFKNFKSTAFLPLKNNLFVRGQEKINLIKTYFDSLLDAPQKDYYWSKLIYGTQN